MEDLQQTVLSLLFLHTFDLYQLVLTVDVH